VSGSIFGISIFSIVSIICFIPAIVFHEVAHGFVANKLGDPTARSQGRLSLNPIKHVDPFGTVLLPLLLMIANAPVFGYAKPVPYNPSYFKDIRKGELMTGLAGPAANLLLGIISAAVANIISVAVGASLPLLLGQAWYAADPTAYPLATVAFCLYAFTMINFCLMFFNLLPIPPLDGSSIIAVFLNDNQLRSYYRIQRYALPILMILLIVVPYVLNFSPIGIYIDATAGNLTDLLFGD
jgi:Zn-dependent protease